MNRRSGHDTEHAIFDELTNPYREIQQHHRKRTTQNSATAGGVLLLISAVLPAIVWAAGIDRFLWLTAAWASLGALLTIAGAMTTAVTKSSKENESLTD